ncbi:MAG TPA: ATP cone domain-containing protein [Candidatus Saccharimonadales bacterium]
MSSTEVGIIKRSGRRPSEAYKQEKLHDSIQAACLSVRSPEGEAAQIARIVSDLVSKWCLGRHAVTSQDLRRVASKHLDHLHPEAAYLYQHHQFVL